MLSATMAAKGRWEEGDGKRLGMKWDMGPAVYCEFDSPWRANISMPFESKGKLRLMRGTRSYLTSSVGRLDSELDSGVGVYDCIVGDTRSSRESWGWNWEE